MKKGVLIPYGMEDVFTVLDKLNEPVMESSLIHQLSNEFGYPRLHQDYLFEFHFSLYHVLYNIKNKIDDVYLHTDMMRIRMLPLPEKGSCGHYIQSLGVYCGKKTKGFWCSEHDSGQIPVEDFMKPFFLNSENISFGENCDISSVFTKIITYGLQKKEVDEALAFFSVPYLEKKSLHRSYRACVKKHHPDCGGDGELIKDANRHYNLLKSLL